MNVWSKYDITFKNPVSCVKPYIKKRPSWMYNGNKTVGSYKRNQVAQICEQKMEEQNNRIPEILHTYLAL